MAVGAPVTGRTGSSEWFPVLPAVTCVWRIDTAAVNAFVPPIKKPVVAANHDGSETALGVVVIDF
jgi:hypothetical protein